MKIKPSQRLVSDCVAWFPDKRGSFSVKSAYSLALQEKISAGGLGASSVRPDGRRPAWDLIWRNPAPPKVHIFAWKLAHEALATEATKKSKHMQNEQACTICGHVTEDAHHALVRCPHAAGLWNSMREIWDIPGEEEMHDTESEWIFRLLEKLNETQRMMVLMILWRAWHVRNEVTHEKPAVPIEVSRRFLASYAMSLLSLQQHPDADPIKGKQVVDYFGEPVRKQNPMCHVEHWTPPVAGCVKLNVDGSFQPTDGTAGAGMILRDHLGDVMLAAIRGLGNCADALEAELAAIHEGITLSLNWTELDILVETDSADAVQLISAAGKDRSAHTHKVMEIRSILSQKRRIQIMKIKRNVNVASHTLAHMVRTQ